MVRLLTILLCGFLVAGDPAPNMLTKPVALTVELREEQDVQRLLDGLQKLDARITFFLGSEEISPEQTAAIMEAGHEIGLTIHSREQGALLSRRHMAAQILENRAVLPRRVKIHWLRLEEGATDGARQVARVKGMAILGDHSGSLQEGCVMDLGSASVDEVLLTVHRLQGQGYRPVTVSELARLNRVQVQPGRVYGSF